MTRRHFPHDMGGEDGSAVIPDALDGPVFKEDWHSRALAITVLSGAHGKWNLDESRHIRETLPSEDYEKFSYYEKWMSGLANLLVRHGLVTRQELKQGHADALSELQPKTLTHDKVKAAMAKGGPTTRPDQRPRKFNLGDKVTTKHPEETALVANGHTRLPQYAGGKQGVIIAHYDSHILPDSHAHGLGEAPEHLYAVEFLASDLFADAAQGDKVVVDCWESYLT